MRPHVKRALLEALDDLPHADYIKDCVWHIGDKLIALRELEMDEKLFIEHIELLVKVFAQEMKKSIRRIK